MNVDNSPPNINGPERMGASAPLSAQPSETQTKNIHQMRSVILEEAKDVKKKANYLGMAFKGAMLAAGILASMAFVGAGAAFLASPMGWGAIGCVAVGALVLAARHEYLTTKKEEFDDVKTLLSKENSDPAIFQKGGEFEDLSIEIDTHKELAKGLLVFGAGFGAAMGIPLINAKFVYYATASFVGVAAFGGFIMTGREIGQSLYEFFTDSSEDEEESNEV